MTSIEQFWNWLVSEGADLDKAWKGIAAVIGFLTAVISFLTLVVRYIFKSRAKPAAQPANQMIITLSADLAALLQSRLPKPVNQAEQDATIEKFKDSVNYISANRRLFEPPSLAAEGFPKELDVYDWEPGKLLKIRIPQSLGERVFVGLFSLPACLILPILAGSFLLDWLTGEFAGFIGGFIGGVAVGFALWVWINRRGSILKIDFEKKEYFVSGPVWLMPGSYMVGSLRSGLPREVLIKEGAIGGQPALTLELEGIPIVNLPITPTARDKLITFANSLLWAMRRQIEIAPGVYIGPSASVDIPAYSEKPS